MSVVGEHLKIYVHGSRLSCAWRVRDRDAGAVGWRWCPAWRTSCCHVASSDGRTPRHGHGATSTLLGYSVASPPPATTFALLPMDQLCSESSGLYVGQAHHWLQHWHEVIKMNKDPQFSLHPTPLMPSHWQRAASAFILEKKSISLRLWAHLSKASMFAALDQCRCCTLCIPLSNVLPVCLCKRRALC